MNAPITASETTASADGGFSLIEALVAMAILAIVAVALLRTNGTHITRIDGLETRAFARFVAENRIAEITLDPSDMAALPREVGMLGRRWSVSAVSAATGDPDLLEVVVSVGETGLASPVSRLSAFVDQGGDR